MRFLLRILPLLAFSFLLVSCGGSKVSKPESSTYLFLSQGGGITGKYEGFILYEDGRVEVTEGEGQENPKPKRKLPSREASKIFEAWNVLDVQDKIPFKPGNMNYKIIYGSGPDLVILDWSDGQKVDTEIQEFFSETYRKLRNAE
ncbi:hypothetical protein [Owenweeksia hongkongensis]|uniref:hypothetical protein n=1 Tax=Owenweeksia hongkongensis TaxID=253245 RepID=UPI003A91000E